MFNACGVGFGAEELALVRGAIEQSPPPNRAEVARRVCAALQWTDALGRPKLMSCRVALLRLHRAGLVELPEPTCGNGNGKRLSREVELPEAVPVEGSVEALGGLELERVEGRRRSALWNRLIERYHLYGPVPFGK